MRGREKGGRGEGREKVERGEGIVRGRKEGGGKRGRKGVWRTEREALTDLWREEGEKDVLNPVTKLIIVTIRSLCQWLA